MTEIKIKKNIKVFISILFVSIFLSLITAPVDASAEVEKTKLSGVRESNDFAVGPGKSETILDPGESVTKYISVTNRINETVNFKLTVEDFVGSDDPTQGVVLLGDEVGPYSLTNFIKPEISSFSLEFGERITIPVKIDVPEDAEPRGYYGAVLIANEPPEKIDDETGLPITEGVTKIISRVGSLFLVKVNGDSIENGETTDFDLIESNKSFLQSRPDGFQITFKNKGNVHLLPYGEISIKNILGKEVRRLPVDAYFVLPDSTRARNIIWNDTFFGIGRYSAELSLYKGYGDESDYETMSVGFWILPWKTLLIIFVSLVILFTLVYYVLSRFELKRKR